MEAEMARTPRLNTSIHRTRLNGTRQAWHHKKARPDNGRAFAKNETMRLGAGLVPSVDQLGRVAGIEVMLYGGGRTTPSAPRKQKYQSWTPPEWLRQRQSHRFPESLPHC